MRLRQHKTGTEICTSSKNIRIRWHHDDYEGKRSGARKRMFIMN